MMGSQFMNRRLHSLLGVIPVGFFLLEHLYTNFQVTKGSDAFVEQVEWLWGLPLLPVLEILFIFLPLLYHAVYGTYIAFQAQHNVNRFGTFRNYMFLLQRITGVLTFVYIIYHVWSTRIAIMFVDAASDTAKAQELANITAQHLSSPIVLTIYIIGLIGAVFHFSNGMWSFLVSWGVTVGPRAQLVSSYVWGVAFLVISYIGVRALWAFHHLPVTAMQ
ncbi:succinate dehydrogenase cytochrome b558 subunit [Risungbinella massiliensis]|uniref:succinate dehydrogenase cytochrome b558 subunit n=1 Tax=Risungbinella massiliensis TaxID=1329796 RepID=UPI0005CC1523|nr:succinate dehydrogenase cytochrome b558 subunit [Risungbinella massiliensis]